jgi:hypothetical protein
VSAIPAIEPGQVWTDYRTSEAVVVVSVLVTQDENHNQINWVVARTVGGDQLRIDNAFASHYIYVPPEVFKWPPAPPART